jgi:Tfp pilus assembly protein PilO
MNTPQWWKLDGAGGAILVGLSIAAWMLVVRPYNAAVTTQQSLEAQLQTELAQAADLRQNVSEARRAAELAEADAEASEIRLLPASQLNSRVAALTNLAAEHKLQVDIIAPSEPVYRTHRGEIPIRIEGKGSYPNVSAFLSTLHRQHKDTALRSMSLTSDPNGAASGYRVELIWAVAPPSQPAQPPKS